MAKAVLAWVKGKPVKCLALFKKRRKVLEKIWSGSISMDIRYTIRLPPVMALQKLLCCQLPKEQAFLIELAFFRGMSHTEIAEETHIPLGTVKTRLRSGLHRLRELWIEATKQTSTNP